MPSPSTQTDEPHVEQRTERPTFICRHCGHAMTIVQVFIRGEAIRAPP